MLVKYLLLCVGITRFHVVSLYSYELHSPLFAQQVTIRVDTWCMGTYCTGTICVPIHKVPTMISIIETLCEVCAL